MLTKYPQKYKTLKKPLFIHSFHTKYEMTCGVFILDFTCISNDTGKIH